MAYHIHSHIKTHLHYELNMATFSWGSIKPDIVPSLALRKHEKEDSFSFLTERIVRLMKLHPHCLQDERKRRHIESELGIICHFLTDFFCFTHTQRCPFKHGMFSHIRYESSLHKLAKQLPKIEPVPLPVLSGKSFVDIERFLQEALSEYEQKQNVKRDIMYAVSVCIRIVFSYPYCHFLK
ncbi:zinc dependent phospholipase C family protein (plasmid) [Aneurinibacillus sp. Ricciae_BoGa-3]|nr:zinc dependent phospholipase C family protein [Aneurinibacillus sp. Ricciae_BoGa-3]WCK57777.1 zinc dependent phospholipase C family protein [Aneurinibacillus sp. Ricciae_BoGa-3]